MMAHFYLILLLHFLPCNKQTSADSIIKIVAPQVIVHAGKKAVMPIYVTIKNGYHIQANKVKDEFIIPSTLEINADKIVTTGEQVFPVSKKFRLAGTSDYLMVYDGKLKITIPFKTSEKTQKGEYKLNARFHYQACDDKSCFSPKTIDFSITLKVI